MYPTCTFCQTQVRLETLWSLYIPRLLQLPPEGREFAAPKFNQFE